MTKRVLAVASGGGHWQQLQLLREGYGHCDVLYLTTLPGLPEQFGATPAAIIPDCNRSQALAVLRCALALAGHLLRHRPHVVISTGALPGLLALILGRVGLAQTIWIDSVANAETMSASGRWARRFAHLWLCQWQHVADETGAEHAGAVL